MLSNGSRSIYSLLIKGEPIPCRTKQVGGAVVRLLLRRNMASPGLRPARVGAVLWRRGDVQGCAGVVRTYRRSERNGMPVNARLPRQHMRSLRPRVPASSLELTLGEASHSTGRTLANMHALHQRLTTSREQYRSRSRRLPSDSQRSGTRCAPARSPAQVWP